MTYLKKKLTPIQRAQQERRNAEKRARIDAYNLLKTRNLLTLTREELHRLMYHNPRSLDMYWKSATGKLRKMKVNAYDMDNLIQIKTGSYKVKDVLALYHGENFTPENVVALAQHNRTPLDVAQLYLAQPEIRSR